MDWHVCFGWMPFLKQPSQGFVSPPSTEPGTFHMLGERVNHHTIHPLILTHIFHLSLSSNEVTTTSKERKESLTNLLLKNISDTPSWDCPVQTKPDKQVLAGSCFSWSYLVQSAVALVQPALTRPLTWWRQTHIETIRITGVSQVCKTAPVNQNDFV